MGGSLSNHVVNDRLADHPLSVAHCDRTGCTAVVRGDKGASRLNLVFGGWHQGQMYVRANGPFVYSLATLEPDVKGTRPFPFAQGRRAQSDSSWRAIAIVSWVPSSGPSVPHSLLLYERTWM